MNVTVKELSKALYTLKPSYRSFPVPVLRFLYIRCEGKFGTMACVDVDKKTDHYYVKSIDFECDGTLTFLILPKILRDILKVTEGTLKINLDRKKVEIHSGETVHWQLDMPNPNEFPNFNKEGSNIVYMNRLERLQQIVYDTMHQEEYRHTQCLRILERMRKLK